MQDGDLSDIIKCYDASGNVITTNDQNKGGKFLDNVADELIQRAFSGCIEKAPPEEYVQKIVETMSVVFDKLANPKEESISAEEKINKRRSRSEDFLDRLKGALERFSSQEGDPKFDLTDIVDAMTKLKDSSLNLALEGKGNQDKGSSKAANSDSNSKAVNANQGSSWVTRTGGPKALLQKTFAERVNKEESGIGVQTK